MGLKLLTGLIPGDGACRALKQRFNSTQRHSHLISSPQPDSRSHHKKHPTETIHPPAFLLALSFPIPPLWLGFGTHEDESCIYLHKPVIGHCLP